MRRKTNQKIFEVKQELDNLWSLRIIVKNRLFNQFIREHDFRNDDVALQLGLIDEAQYGDNHNNKVAVINQLKKQLSDLEKLSSAIKPSDVLVDNVEQIAQLISLNDIEKQILIFTVVLSESSLLEDVTSMAGELSLGDCCQIISAALNIPAKDIINSLMPNSLLVSSGLITIYKRGKSRLASKIECLNNRFVEKITSIKTEPSDLIKESVKCSTKATLSIKNYEHLKHEIDRALAYLKEVSKTNKLGSNILIYGTPGTGKTQFAKVLANRLKKELFEISYSDEEDEPIEGLNRLRAFKTAQAFLKNKQPILLFDEAEDVFSSDTGDSFVFMFGKKSRQTYKAWINKQLEENQIPTIWITNNIDSIDDAIIRRFDMVFEMPIPPKNERIKIAKLASKQLLDDASLDIIGANQNIAPAIISKSVEVATMISRTNKKNEFSNNVILLIEETLKAQGYKNLKKPSKKGDFYDASLSNCNFDLNGLRDGLARTQEGRVILFGPPGTGKTAFGKWLAKELDKELVMKKGSDLLGKYVGENEKNIAKAFDEARKKDAILLFDEVDSFLNDRSSAHTTWEISAVNEMLTQMESFEGIFIASTNLMGNIDSAAIRRFDAKVEFGYMKPAQAKSMFEVSCKKLSIELDEMWTEKIGYLGILTPGDFAAVERRSRFLQIGSARELYEKLQYECSLKKDFDSRKIGFAS